MSLTAFAIEKKAVSYFAVFLIVTAGFASFFKLGQLEDPEFTVKTAVITTTYPGASPMEVELEVTDRLELAIQELHELKWIESFSRAGMSLIKVEIKPEYWSDRLPQVWDTLRRKIRDVEGSLPPGTGRPDVGDDYGDVFGFQLALTGDGYSYAELEDLAKFIKKELSLVKGVARIDLWGNQQKVIYLDTSQTQLSQLGLTDENIEATLKQQNLVVDAGSVDVQIKRLRIHPSGEFQTPEDIGDLQIRPTILDSVQGRTTETTAKPSTELIRIRDIGTVSRGYRQPPQWLLRYNGEPAIGLSITNISGINIVKLGQAIDKRIEELVPAVPIGLELDRIHWQSEIVDDAVSGFLINFAEAVAIVLVILTIFMGWRMGVIIGCGLIATILGSFIIMAIFGIDLQRMSLGALVIALGMMVDNSIVVADGFVIRLQQGMDRKQAAIEAASIPSMPLLGATIVAVMAFYPIFASVESAGEYCRTLFTVVAISLLTSWVIAMTLTPLQCMDMMPDPEKGGEDKDPYGGKFYQKFRLILEKAIRLRILTIGGLFALLVISLVGFGNLKQQFFPFSSMSKFMIDVWMPEGTRIQDVAEQMRNGEKKLLSDERIENVTAYIGQGPPRFYLPVDPEYPFQYYGQFIANVRDFREIDDLMIELDPWLVENVPYALIPLRKYGVGPTKTWKFELRIGGPAEADPAVLRSLADQVLKILYKSPLAGRTTTDWRQRVQKLVPEYNQQRGRWAGVTREDIGRTTKRAFDGRDIGLYREGDDLIPIVLRHVEEERLNVGGIDTLQVQPALSTETVPLSQVTDSVLPEWEDPLIWRRDRRRTVKVQSNPIPGVTLPTLRDSVLADIEAIELPPGYSMEWGGEYEDTVDAQASLVPGVVPAVAIMLFIIVALFNAFRPPIIIVSVIPFALIGVVAGLLPTGTPFGFLALLGAMSLSGMMIKNSIVLLDQVNIEIAEGKNRYQAILAAALSRLRPVALAAATTVFGVIPLVQDPFWIGLAITIMFGLTFGTVLTMVAVPVFYATLYKLKSPEEV